MWERIGNGLSVGAKKSGGDVDIFVNHVLEYIKANSAMVASCEPLHFFLSEIEIEDEEFKRDFLRIIEQKKNVILVHARNQWKASGGK